MEKLYGGRNWHTSTENLQQCIVRLETVLQSNINLRARSDDNPLPRAMLKAVVAIADTRGVWRMSDDDHAFLMEESRSKEMNNEFDAEMALAAREEQERQQMWKQAPANNDDNSEEDEEVEGDEPIDIRGGGDGMLQVEEEENKLKRKWSQAFMTENDKEEDEFDEMMNGYPMQINFM